VSKKRRERERERREWGRPANTKKERERKFEWGRERSSLGLGCFRREKNYSKL